MHEPHPPLALVIGDKSSFSRIIGDTLGSGGFRYEAIAAQAAAVELWKCNQHDLLVLDQECVTSPGLEVCREIRRQQHGGNVPILIVGDSHDAPRVQEAIALGGSDFVSLNQIADLLLHKARFLVQSSQTLIALESSLAQLRETQLLARMGMWSWLPDGELLRFDDNAVLLSEMLLPREVALERFLRLVHTEDREKVRNSFFELAWGGEHRIEYRLVDPHGRIRVVAQRGASFLHRGEIHFNGTLQDVTAQRQADDRLVMLQDALDSLPLGITITDRDGRIVYANPAEEQLHGYAQGELLGLHASLLGPGKPKVPGKPKLEQWTRWTRDGVNQRKDGRVFPVRLHSSPVRDARGNPVGMVTACEERPDPSA